MSLTPSIEDFVALQSLLQETQSRLDSVTGENRILRTERDLLKERLNKFMRKIFAAKSEVSSQNQKDMFFNEAEVLGAQAQPAEQEDDGEDEGIDVPAHNVPSVAASPSILPCLVPLFAMNCQRASVSVRMMDRL